ncbi:Sodium channel protein Nach [Trachymyrmex cornetzi]|uniref:Sodium channel protein Nach n=1 Tax=Trachymyrmex cornetzi TaxID=471704 RepID=A0A195DZ79_9HYME|nr:Sodium channel protein Nach [Trachymyrmex cornetzi]
MGSRWPKKLQYAFGNTFSHSVVPLASGSYNISINMIVSKNMKPNWNKKSKFDNVKHGYRKCLAYGKKHLGWFNIYCDNTNLHGFRYISMDGSSIIESILWFLVCMLSIVFCAILMLRLWANYSNNPIVTTIYTSNPIWDMSFPAVTICNNNKVYRPHVDLIAKNLYMDGFTTNDSDKFFSSLTKLIRPNKISIDSATARQVLNRLDMTVEALMKQLMQPCSALLLRCIWIGKVHDCSKIFKTVKSSEGFCCAFNSHYELNVGHMSKVKAFNSTDFNNTSEDDLPGVHTIVKAPGSGRDVGLAVALNIEPDMYKATSRPFIGASVIIHGPIDFPDIGARITTVPVGHVLATPITGTSIRGMESLRAIPLEKRLCYFDNEVPGEIRYSHQSCISDCIAKYTHHTCGCLPFYYPEARKGTKTCYLSDINCLLSIRKMIPHHAGTCKKCLPQCTDMLYTINPEHVKMEGMGFDSDLMHGFNMKNTSFVYVFFGDVSYVEYRKESTISWDSLLASFGGIFGLCLGGSVLSVIELGYLLARQLFRRQKKMLKWQEQSRMKLPPASEVFLSIPAKEKIQLRKLRNRQESDDKRTFVGYQPVLHQRKTTNLDNMYYIEHVRF